MTMKNTVAYHGTEIITTVKSFNDQALGLLLRFPWEGSPKRVATILNPGPNVIKLLTVVINKCSL
jgi:hypothetical protein